MYQLQESLRDEESKVKQYEQLNEDQDKEIAQLKKQNEQLKAQYDDLLNQFNQIQEEYQDVNGELEKSETKICKLTDYVGELEKQIVNLEVKKVCMEESMSQNAN